jgi:hypothetical protein
VFTLLSQIVLIDSDAEIGGASPNQLSACFQPVLHLCTYFITYSPKRRQYLLFVSGRVSWILKRPVQFRSRTGKYRTVRSRFVTDSDDVIELLAQILGQVIRAVS